MSRKSKINFDKKQATFKSPNLSKMQEVIIDDKTRIYIDADADPVEGRKRYLERLGAR